MTATDGGHRARPVAGAAAAHTRDANSSVLPNRTHTADRAELHCGPQRERLKHGGSGAGLLWQLEVSPLCVANAFCKTEPVAAAAEQDTCVRIGSQSQGFAQVVGWIPPFAPCFRSRSGST